MSKFIQLTTSAYVNGRMRHPNEGVLHLEDDEANRLLDNNSGTDVTPDFSSDDRKDVPIEGLRASGADVAAAQALVPIEYQSNTPTPETADASPEAKPAKKEAAK
jgi:hypothetical protein